MKRKLSMVLLSIIMVVSLAIGSVSLFAFGTEETMVTWSSLTGGVYDGVTYATPVQDFWLGKDANGNRFYQTEAGHSYCVATDDKYYVDGFSFTVSIAPTDADVSFNNGANYIIGLKVAMDGNFLAGIQFKYNAEKCKFDMYYLSAAFVQRDGAELSTYPGISGIEAGEQVKITFKANATAGLDIYVNDSFAYTTSYYPSFPAPGYAFSSDSGGYYGYLVVDNNYVLAGGTQNVNNRITFYELTANGFASGSDSVYDADDSSTYAQGTTIGSVTNDFAYATLTSGTMKGKTLYKSGSAGAFSFAYTDKAILNAFSISLNAMHTSTKDTPAYAIKFTSGENYLTLRLEKASATVATVYLVTPTGTDNLGTTAFDWVNKNATQICNIGLFINSDSVVWIIGSSVYTLEAEYLTLLNSFEKQENNVLATVEVINEVGNSYVVISELISDGTAVAKKVARSIQTSLATVELENGATFTNPYNTVEVLFYDGTTETFNVTWNNDVVNTKYAKKYVVTGSFEGITSAYYFAEEIKTLLTFNVEVGYPEGFIEYGSTDYIATGSVWDSCGGGANNFRYKKNSDGSETLLTDGYKSASQFMPASTKYRDIDGYTITFTEERFGTGSGLLILEFLAQPKHHVEFGTKFFGLAFNTQSDDQFYINFGTNSKAAYLKDSSGTLHRLISGASAEKTVRLALVENDGVKYVKYYLTVNGNEYEVVKDDGSDYTDVAAVLSSFVNDRMYVMLWNEQGIVALTVKEDYTKYVTSYTKPSDVIVNYGSEHGLPTSITLTLNNGATVEGTITWTGDFNKEVAGNYNLTGTISYNGEVALGNGKTIFDDVESEFKVKVTVKEEVKTITAFELPENVTIKIGEEYTLPTTFTVSVYSDYTQQTTQVEISVVWSGSVNSLLEGTYTVTASPVGGYVFAEGVNASVNVIVKASGSGSGCGSSVAVSSLFGGIAMLGFAVLGLKKKK